ncbi:MAG: hypothetical protein RL367_2295 [Pseudomonadota bacterium]
MMRSILIIAAMILPGPAFAETTSWYRFLLENGQSIGTGRQDVTTSRDGRQITASHQIRVKEEGNVLTVMTERTRRSENLAGQTIAIDQVSHTGRDEVHSSVAIQGPAATLVATLVRQTRFDRQTRRIALPAGVRFDMGGGLLASWDPVKTPKLEFENFSIAAQGVEHIVLQARADRSPDPEGRITIVRQSYDGPNLRAVAELILDKNHQLVETRQPMFGTSIRIETTDQATASKPTPAFSMIRNAFVKSPFRILQPALSGHIRYIFRFKDNASFPLPQTGEQRVTMGPDQVTLDICPRCTPETPATAPELEAARQPSLWMQSESPVLQKMAAPIRAKAIPDAEKMNLLAKRARLSLRTMDFSGHYSALEAIARHGGDCTEDAVVLAALGRAAGIPTRVASGLVYSREDYHGVSNVFMPHSWTLAWIDGRWQSFDMSIPGFDATHIALTIGEGDAKSIFAASQLASLLQWEKMIQIKAAQKAAAETQ